MARSDTSGTGSFIITPSVSDHTPPLPAAQQAQQYLGQLLTDHECLQIALRQRTEDAERLEATLSVTQEELAARTHDLEHATSRRRHLGRRERARAKSGSRSSSSSVHRDSQPQHAIDEKGDRSRAEQSRMNEQSAAQLEARQQLQAEQRIMTEWRAEQETARERLRREQFHLQQEEAELAAANERLQAQQAQHRLEARQADSVIAQIRAGLAERQEAQRAQEQRRQAAARQRMEEEAARQAAQEEAERQRRRRQEEEQRRAEQQREREREQRRREEERRQQENCPRYHNANSMQPGETMEDFFRRTVHFGDSHHDPQGGYVFRSTNRDGLRGVAWMDNSTYRSRAGNTFDTNQPPPQPCFNCGGDHWRKHCPHRR
eukprot:TRINITY_DN101899_c0_g1_i1.p1 TRINITY_DN101899_c0_g1~~TRINITY_DN101899_c0_g1_i1.p1  ORF type:complete len:398 (-),score=83.04 TRINITY_DN101899_c0_g1_i1:446-1573(-)